MKGQKTLRARLSLLLAVTLVVGGQTSPLLAQNRVTAKGQKEPVVINFGQPNIWSLEQAHYLLARLRDRSLDLKTRTPDDEDLDPNAANGKRLRSLKTFFGAGVNFDQTAGLQNRLFQGNAEFNRTRRETLLTTRDQLQSDLRAATERHSALVIERSLMNLNNATDAQKAHKSVEVGEADAGRKRLEAEVAAIDKELTALSVPAGQLTSPTPPDAATSRLSESVADKLLGSESFRNELGNDVRLNASSMLENHVQFQYEIIAKQLTLLRDEVGPGERLIFLELPQSIYTVPDKANRKLAQVWWRVEGYYATGTPTPTPTPLPAEACPAPIIKSSGAMALNQTEMNQTPEPATRLDRNERKVRLEQNPYQSDRPRSQEDILKSLTASNFVPIVKEQNRDSYALLREKGNPDLRTSIPAEGQIRTVDLIPRQSSLNINDIQDKVKNFNLAGAFTFLFGLGARVDYQRQRRLFEQFMHQDIYASAFGKGASDFGWTFGPVPGTERVAPGLHTTYAVLVVPDDAEAIELKARGCYLRRTDYAPISFNDTSEAGETLAARSKNIECREEQRFKIPVPGASENNFWVTGINYAPVKPNDRVVVMVHGEYFSPQIGVLVDGVPLRRSIGVAQVELVSSHRNDEYVPEPRGEYELVNSKLLVMAFKMPKDYEGTPSIALVTPGRARVVNDLRLIINNSYRCTEESPNCCCLERDARECVEKNPDGTCARFKCTRLAKYKRSPEPETLDEKHSAYVRLEAQSPMFSAVVPSVPLTIDNLSVLQTSGGSVRAYLTGTRFLGDEKKGDGIFDEVTVNGKAARAVRKTPKVYELTFEAGNSDEWNVAIFQSNKVEGQTIRTQALKSFPNPSVLQVSDVEIIDYASKSRPTVLTVKLVGRGFTGTTSARALGGGKDVPAEFLFSSPREAIVKLTSPTRTLILTIDNGANAVSRSIKLPPPKEKKPKPKYKVFEDTENADEGDNSEP